MEKEIKELKEAFEDMLLFTNFDKIGKMHKESIDILESAIDVVECYINELNE